MKFLIDECLSPELATLARDKGYEASTHVSWLGMSGAPDWLITRRAAEDGYVLVTHNTVDFRPLFGRESLHVGLVGFNTPAKFMDRALQKRLFLLAMKELAGEEVFNTSLEITVNADRTITVEQYRLPR